MSDNRETNHSTETAHVCPTPAEGLPGDEWTCLTCGAAYFADEPDYSDVDGAFIEWVRLPPGVTT